MVNIAKFFYQIRVGTSSEAEVKYTQLSNAAEAAADAAKAAEKIDKMASKAKATSLTSKICKAFNNDIEDLLG